MYFKKPNKCITGNYYFNFFWFCLIILLLSLLYMHQVTVNRLCASTVLTCLFTSAGDQQPPRAVHPDAEWTKSGRSAGRRWWWRRWSWRSRGSRRDGRWYTRRESHELHPGHTTGERGHWEGEEEHDTVTNIFTLSLKFSTALLEVLGYEAQIIV